MSPLYFTEECSSKEDRPMGRIGSVLAPPLGLERQGEERRLPASRALTAFGFLPVCPPLLISQRSWPAFVPHEMYCCLSHS